MAMPVHPAKASETLKISVVMPAYNEVHYIYEIIRRVMASPVEKELVVVDDCSTDGAQFRLDEIAVARRTATFACAFIRRTAARVPRFGQDFQASGDIVVVQDAGLEYDPNGHPKLIAPILEDKADVVYGSCFDGGESQPHAVLLALPWKQARSYYLQ
jgi:glycosyltransferase involved in cell wall biosynthesis